MRSLIAPVLMTLLLAGCGQTGPLYLPEKELPKDEPAPAPAVKAAPAAAENPAAPAAVEATEAK